MNNYSGISFVSSFWALKSVIIAIMLRLSIENTCSIYDTRCTAGVYKDKKIHNKTYSPLLHSDMQNYVRLPGYCFCHWINVVCFTLLKTFSCWKAYIWQPGSTAPAVGSHTGEGQEKERERKKGSRRKDKKGKGLRSGREDMWTVEAPTVRGCKWSSG